jgi:hypothetical protein
MVYDMKTVKAITLDGQSVKYIHDANNVLLWPYDPTSDPWYRFATVINGNNYYYTIESNTLTLVREDLISDLSANKWKWYHRGSTTAFRDSVFGGGCWTNGTANRNPYGNLQNSNMTKTNLRYETISSSTAREVYPDYVIQSTNTITDVKSTNSTRISFNVYNGTSFNMDVYNDYYFNLLTANGTGKYNLNPGFISNTMSILNDNTGNLPTGTIPSSYSNQIMCWYSPRHSNEIYDTGNVLLNNQTSLGGTSINLTDGTWYYIAKICYPQNLDDMLFNFHLDDNSNKLFEISPNSGWGTQTGYGMKYTMFEGQFIKTGHTLYYTLQIPYNTVQNTNNICIHIRLYKI